MPETFELSELNIPEGSEFHRLLDRCPNVTTALFADGEYLVREDDPSRDIFMVLRGGYVVEHASVEPSKGPASTLATEVTEDPSEPSFVGEMAYLGGGVRTASVKSSGASFALRLKPEHCDIIVAEFPLFTQVLCKRFAARLRETNHTLEEHQKLFSMDVTQEFKKPGDIVFAKGDPADTLYQLVTGTLTRQGEGAPVTITPDQLNLGFLEPLAYFQDGRYSATVKAETDAILVAIAKSSKLAVVRNFPQVVLSCLK